MSLESTPLLSPSERPEKHPKGGTSTLKGKIYQRPSGCCCCCERLRRRRDRRRYYARLRELQEGYEEDDACIVHRPMDEEEKATRGDNVLARIVLLINVGLLIGKGIATYSTSGSSLSIISTLLDSIVDITSGLVMWLATYAILHTDVYFYPHGRENLEAIGTIFIGLIMGMANAYIVLQSVEAVVNNKPAPDLTITSLGILLGTVLIKAILYILCRWRGTHSANVLSIDQRNDVLTNLVAVGGAVASNLYHPFMDPLAASLISGYIAYSWFKVVLGEMPRLSGVAGTDILYSRVARVCITTSPLLRCLDTLLVYHTGHKVRVEVHVVLPAETKSKQVIDEVVVPMRRRLQALPFVDRAFVHADYECDGYDKV